MKRTQATNQKGVLSTERAALALTSRMLSKPHKVRQVISPTRSIMSVEEAAVVPFVQQTKSSVILGLARINRPADGVVHRRRWFFYI